MILSKVGDRSFLVNLLANYILEKIGIDSSTVIKVVDLGNFFVIKGKTESKDILNLSDVISEFTEKFKHHFEELKITNTIDLIEYDCEIEELKKLTLTLHNTDKSDFHYKQIEYFENNQSSTYFDFVPKSINQNDLVFTSEFPYGYSMNQGRSLYYYIKKIFYSLPSNYPITTLTITINESNEGDDFIEVYNNFHGNNDDTLKSAILDCMDFTKNQVELQMKKVDCNLELLNPLEEHPYLKDGKKFMII